MKNITRRNSIKYSLGTLIAGMSGSTFAHAQANPLPQQKGKMVNSWFRQKGRHPRLVAHRGFSAACPENTLPAFGAALALGADEIELDVWETADGEMVILHDKTLERTTNFEGDVTKMKWADIKNADAGVKKGPEWEGIPIARLEDVWNALHGLIDFNVHIKHAGNDGKLIAKVVELAQKYKIENQIYLACNHSIMEIAKEQSDGVPLCCLSGGLKWGLVDFAAKNGCARVQFNRKYCDEEHIEAAHEQDIICNLFYSEEAEDAKKYFDWGIDAILTNHLATVLPAREHARKAFINS